MAKNNLRIVYDNKATQIGGSATNLALNDYKSATTTAATTYTVTTTAISGPVCVMAMIAEDTGTSTLTVTAGSSTASSTDNSTSLINTAPTIGYGGVKYMAVYFPNLASTTSFTLTFNTPEKLSRVVIGNYWTPTYNTNYGITVGYTDASTHERLQSGDLYTVVGPRNKTLTFELQYLNEADKFRLFDIIRTRGKVTPIFVSAFPDDTDKEKEQMFQIYGKFSEVPGLSHTMYTMYASTITLEEI
jgi:hypothetical protein